MDNQLMGFYPDQNGAFGTGRTSDATYSRYSGAEESGAMGCGIRPLCSKTKWVTEMQSKCKKVLGKNICVSVPHQKQVPAMDCVLKHDAYNACISASGGTIDTSDVGLPDTSTPSDDTTQATDTTSVNKSSVKNPPVTTKINTTTIVLITVLGLVIIGAIIVIARVTRNKKE